MTAVRKKKLTQLPPLVVPGLKPRNPLVAPALQRKAGAHQTPQSLKAKERAEARRAMALNGNPPPEFQAEATIVLATLRQVA